MVEEALVTQLEDEEAALEVHRPFVREVNRRMANVYSVGGGAVLGVGALVIAVGGWLGELDSAIWWSMAVTAFLVALFVLRAVVRRRARAYREEFEAYCEVNEADPAQLRRAFGGEELFPYFEAIFQLEERRAESRGHG